MKRFLAFGVLFAFLAAGLVFGQGTQQAQENQGQAYQEISLFGVQWLLFSGKVLGTPEELGATVALFYVRDKAGIAGIAEFIVIMNAEGTKWKIVGGWIKPYSDDERGFFWETRIYPTPPGVEAYKDLILLQKKKDAGSQLQWRGLEDKDGNPILEFYLKLNDGSEQVVRSIDIKKFVEEYLKDPGK